MSPRAPRAPSVVLGVSIAVASVLLVFAFVPSVPSAGDAWGIQGSTYSPGPTGLKALFRLLDREGMSAERLRRPGYSGLRRDAAFWMLSAASLGVHERRELLSFVQQGGTLVARPKAAIALLQDAKVDAPEAESADDETFLAEDGAQIEPGESTQVLTGGKWPTTTFAAAESGAALVASWQVGKGRLVAFGAPDLAQNDHIGRGQNGIFLVHLARQLGRAHVFDELKTGFATVGIMPLLGRLPYRGLLAQLGITLLVALAAAGIRRLPVEPLRPERRRATRDHVEAVGRLWARSGDTRLPLAALARGADDRAMGHVEASAEPFIDWVRRAKPAMGDRAAQEKRRVEMLSRQPAPPSRALARAAAKGLRAVEREMREW
jgi:hypothetical protein